MTKVILVVPPFLQNPMYLQDPYGENLGIGYLAAYLRQNGIQVELMNCLAQDLNAAQAADRIAHINPQVIGITTSKYNREMSGELQLAKEIRTHGLSAPILLGGHPATFNAEEIVTAFPEIDAVVRGEGELTLLEVVQKAGAGHDWREALGLTFQINGQVINNPSRPLIADLDQLPFPSRDLRPFMDPERRMTARMTASRGCYGHCSFCSISSFYRSCPGKIWRGRSPQNIVDEMEQLQREWNIISVEFVDDIFIGPGTAGRERAYAIAKEIIRRKLFVGFSMETRATEVDRELMAFLKQAGLGTVFLGLESGDQRSLDLYNKQTTVAQNKRAVKIIDELSINLEYGFIMFHPFLTPEDFLENLAFLRELKLCDRGSTTAACIQTTLMVLSGTQLEKDLSASGLLIPIRDLPDAKFNGDYGIRFADKRTQLLHDIMRATCHWKVVAWFDEQKRFININHKWRRLTQHVSNITGLPAQQLYEIPELLGPLMVSVRPKWLNARNQLLVQLMEQVAIALCHEPFSDNLSRELHAMALSRMKQLDQEYLGMSVEEMISKLMSLFSAECISFVYHGESFSVPGLLELLKFFSRLEPHAFSKVVG